MARYMAFAESIVDEIGPPAGVKTSSGTFWEVLEVNADRLIQDSADAESVRSRLSNLGVGALRALSLWMGLNPLQRKADLVAELAAHLAADPMSPPSQTTILINDFVRGRRADAVEVISRLLLPQSQFNLVSDSDIDVNSKCFFCALLVYVQKPRDLQLLMLFERAERAGYTRYALIPRMEVSGDRAVDEETADLAQQHIDAGVDLESLNAEKVDAALERFESRHGHQQSRCVDLFRDEASRMVLVFILRYLRPAYIREVDDVVFGDEAELVMLRLYRRMQVMEEHSSSGVGVAIANTLARELLGDSNVEYIQDTRLTKEDAVEKFINVLAKGEDENLRFRELYLRSAPVEESPYLILRCNPKDKESDLSVPLESFGKKNVRLLEDLDDIRSLKVAFMVKQAKGKLKAYTFRLLCEHARPGSYFLPYSASSVSTRIRSEFERYLHDEYNIQAVPGTG
ncbi:MAG: hypothetical protein JXB30_05110 [Anaerolineae bacterium]|nr:hypothetical protein [Anaerolineae bacterium]